jgi:S-DNA-T family DNA segregation ATPase FtsK/SpoIIIE
MTSPYRMRRQARRIRRGGMQPMMLLTGNDQFPETVIVVILRWVWRYRSELTPLYAAAAVLGAGCWLHAGHRHWWPLVLAIAVMTAGALAAFGGRAGLPTLTERLYAAVTTIAVGGWMVGTAAVGPFITPMPQLLAIGGAVLAVPWWAHGRRRARVRVERKLEAWPEIAQTVGLAGSQVMSAVVDVWGWRARFRLARGQTITDVIAKIPALESGLGTFRGAVRVYPTPDDLANRCELRVLDMDPHADAIPWPGPSVTSITQPIDFGPFEDAAPCRVLFLRRHGLAGGATGGGKSGWLNVLMGNLVACTDVVIWAIDMKKGMELGPWAPCIDRLATTPEEARALLADAVAILEARAALLAARGQRVWEPSPDMPALIILIDEYAELVDDAPGAVKDADSIARRGRAVAVNLIAATQRPTQKAMGQGAVRSQMDVRICFRVRERKDVDLILGQGMLVAGWNATALNAPGKFLISAAEHDTPRRARAYLLTDQAVADTASRYADFRPELDDISRRALTQGDDTKDEEPLDRFPDQAPDGSLEADPETLLWTVLCLAPDKGISIPQLVTATGMSRRWIYYRLDELAAVGRAVQVARGLWHAVAADGDDDE